MQALGVLGMVFSYELFIKGFRDYNQRTSSKIAEQLKIHNKTFKDLVERKKTTADPKEGKYLETPMQNTNAI